MFKNMKIEVNESQNLSDVVCELERLGYVEKPYIGYEQTCITTYEEGFYKLRNAKCFGFYAGELTTLQQLKEMK